MNETEFHLTDKFFSDLRRAILTRGVPLALCAAFAGLFAMSSEVRTDPWMILFMVCVVSVIAVVGIRRGYRQQMESFRGFRIFLGEDAIRRVQPNLPEMAIPRQEITRIVRAPGRGLTVFGADRRNFLGIPESLEGFETVRSTLSHWHEMEERTSRLAPWIPMAAGLGAIALMIATFRSTDRLFTTSAGLVLIALFSYCGVAIHRSRHADARTKRIVWFMPLVVLLVAVQIWNAWSR
jgi:hypothetical protein